MTNDKQHYNGILYDYTIVRITILISEKHLKKSWKKEFVYVLKVYSTHASVDQWKESCQRKFVSNFQPLK